MVVGSAGASPYRALVGRISTSRRGNPESAASPYRALLGRISRRGCDWKWRSIEDVGRRQELPRPLPPKPDRQFSRIRLSSRWSPDGLAQALDSGRSEESHQPRSRLRPAHPCGRSTVRCPAPLQPGLPGAFGRKAFRHYPNPRERSGFSAPNTTFLRPLAPRSLPASQLLRTL